MGQQKVYWSDEVFSEIFGYIKDGQTINDIAKKLGIHPTSLEKQIKKRPEIKEKYHKIKSENAVKRQKERDEAISLYKSGKTMNSIAKMYNVTDNAVRLWLHKAGVKRQCFVKPARETLCWNCKRSTNPKGIGCSWADKFEPVEGWNATKNNDSYFVEECPLFMKDDRR